MMILNVLGVKKEFYLYDSEIEMESESYDSENASGEGPCPHCGKIVSIYAEMVWTIEKGEL
jgi:transposase